jgi:hypothetical protein
LLAVGALDLSVGLDEKKATDWSSRICFGFEWIQPRKSRIVIYKNDIILVTF